MRYIAVVEVETTLHVDLDLAMTTLAEYSPVIGTSGRGWVELRLSFEATGLAHACTTAAAMARAATGAEAIACQVMTEVEHDARHGSAPRVRPAGRHAAEGPPPPILPRQATGSWERPDRERGRHSA